MLQKIVRTLKVQLYLNDQEKAWVDKTLSTLKDGLNYASQIAFDTGILSNKCKLQELVYYSLREKFNLKSQMAVNVCTTVAGSYESQKSNLKSKKSKKKDMTASRFKYVKALYSYGKDYSFLEDGKTISISTIEERMKVPFVVPNYFQKYRDGSWKFGSMEMVKKRGKYYAHVTVNKKIEEPELSSCDNVIGVDLGQNFLATINDSNGYVKFYKGRYLKDVRAKYKHLRKQLQTKGTHNAHNKIASIDQREQRFMTDINHQVSRDIVNHAKRNKSIIVMEDISGINMSSMVRRENRYYRVSWAFEELQSFIEHKAIEEGLRVIYINPKYTSQKCPKCGHIHKDNRDKKNHIFKCRDCGYTANDDYVASQNIKNIGMEKALIKSV